MDFSEAILRARDGDREATEQLLVDWRPWMRVKARGLLGAGQAARLDSSDVVQIALAEVYQNMCNFRGCSQAEWAVWLQRILRGQAIRLRRFNAAEMRRAGRERSGSWAFEDSNDNPTSVVLEQERMAELRSAVKALPAPMQEIVLSRNFDEESFSSIGRRLGQSPRTVRRLWAQALRLLQNSLHDHRLSTRSGRST